MTVLLNLGAAPAGEPRHDAEVRPRRVPHEHPEVRLHATSTSRRRSRSRWRSTRSSTSTTSPASTPSSRARRRSTARPPRRPADRIGARDDAGLRHERAEPRLARDARRPRRHPGELRGRDAAQPVCKLVDPETGEEITEIGDDGVTQPGELWVKGPNVMVGYLQPARGHRRDARRRRLPAHRRHRRRTTRAATSRSSTGVKELIKYKGYQMPPAELEALLLSHPKIAGCRGHRRARR